MESEKEKIKVLFIDDERLLLEQAKIFLEDEEKNIVVDTMLSAKKALAKMDENDYDAVISDYKMPSMGALDMLQQLREEGNEIPFIIFTGRGSEKVADKAVKMGADHYMRKTGNAKSQYDKLASKVVEIVEEKGEKAKKIEESISPKKEEKEDIHARLRHDVENKIHLLKGFFQLLENTDLNQEQLELLKKSKTCADEASSVIEKVRAIQRVDKEEVRKVPLSPVLKEVLEYFKPKAEEQGIELEVKTRLTDGQISVIGGDLLHELFSNLLENSIEHSGAEKLRIRLDKTQGKCKVIIEDDGIGIPDKSKEKLCDKDFKAGDSAGSGL
ncbi:MAG: hybrid sensor histidine kinase/response regulator, partial [Candidatus Thermoplasmatota archaeon]